MSNPQTQTESARAVDDAGVQPDAKPLPNKYCDIIMKGGITSGVVYPKAISELAKTYCFQSIGGASAGALAASATAAAERGRKKGLDSFGELDKLPDELGKPLFEAGPSRLFSLFKPATAAQPVFNTAIAFLGADEGKPSRVIAAAFSNFKPAALMGALPGLLLVVLLMLGSKGLLLAWGLVAGILLIALGSGIAVLYALVTRAVRVLNDHHFGLCTGMNEQPAAAEPALTEWLAALFDRLAGIDEAERPLTFSDLWNTDDPKALHEIDLAMITTNLSHGQPYRLPFEQNDYFFDADEMRAFFPEKVVRWMVEHPRRSAHDTDPMRNGKVLCTLPDPADLPVVVATRMSLAFPILLGAIPLYAIDTTRTATRATEEFNRNKEASTPFQRYTAETCWFSDGGIAINLPIHFFDEALPSWPTFAINLRSFHPDHARARIEAENIWMPDTNNSRDDKIGPWTYFDHGVDGFARVTSFLGTILYTARTWSDHRQLQVQGYRDRVVHIFVGKDEGGLNLKMDYDDMHSLSERGREAGKTLAERFGNPQTKHPLSWLNHRWIRYRATMAAFDPLLAVVRSQYKASRMGEPTYAELVARDNNTLPDSYRWQGVEQSKAATDGTELLFELAEEWVEFGSTFEKNAPEPLAVLQSRPRV